MKDNSVLLVRSTYSHGWHLPGGGVDHGETILAGAHRELREECGLEASSLELHGLYIKNLGRHVDHIAVFTATGVTGEPRIQDPREIAEVRYFPITDLPETLLAGHRRRILEFVTSKHSTVYGDRW